MNILNIVAGIASILSLIISVVAIRKVCKIETKIKMEDNSSHITNSHNKISQKAKGTQITQTGGDLNA